MSSGLLKKYSDFQHTFRKTNNKNILNQVPFKSKIKNKGGKKRVPFIGEGFYFWESNIDGAVRWGNKKYGEGGYSILEIKDWDINTEDLLDLTNRNHAKYFSELKQVYLAANEKAKNYCVGTWIEFFKKVHLVDKKSFPFKLIKSEENMSPKKSKKEGIDFEINHYSASGYYTSLNPLYILCCTEKECIPNNKNII